MWTILHDFFLSYSFFLILEQFYSLSFMQSRHMPETKLTNSKVHTFSPVLIGVLVFRHLKILTVIGIHHANGMSIHPWATQPSIKNTFMTMLIVSSPSALTCVAGVLLSTLHLQFTQTKASSLISAPQCVQNMFLLPLWQQECVLSCKHILSTNHLTNR